jgi:hypothetical protein
MTKIRRIKRTDAEHAEAILAALRSGYSQNNLTGSFFENGRTRYNGARKIVDKLVLDRLLSQNGEFAKEARELLAKNRAANQLAGQSKGWARKRAMTHCMRGHPLSGDNMEIQWNGSRRCITCYREAMRQAKSFKPEARVMVLKALKAGGTISSITRHGPNRIIPMRVLNAIRASNAETNRLIVSLSNKHALIHHAQASAARRARNPEAARAAMDAICRCVSERLPYGHREEVIGAMAEAYVEGLLALGDIPARVHEFVGRQYRQFGQYREFGAAPLSLDAAAYREGDTKLIDTISTGLWN